MNLIGETIGNIRVEALIGEGGMGDVYAGFDEKLKRKVAVKAIRADRLDVETRARFLREARLLSQLDHPNICRIYEYIEGEQSDYLVLELIHGSLLSDVLEDGIEPRLALEIAEQLARALAAAHAEGVIHRDLKPSNVMLSPAEGGWSVRAKVLDFGLARALEPAPGEWQTGDFAPLDERLLAQIAEGVGSDSSGRRVSSSERSRLRGVLGTVSSMSPEQARGEAATPASDIFSLGLLLQELLTGRPPYEPGLSREVLLIKAAEGDTLPVSGVSTELAELIVELKSLTPESRPDAAQVANRLWSIRGRSKRRLRRYAAAVMVALAVAGAVWHTFDLRRQRDQADAARVRAEQALTEATRMLARRAETLEHALGTEHPDVGMSYVELARLLERAGDTAGARQHYRRALDLWLGSGHLGKVRPIVEDLFEQGWGDDDLRERYRRRGLALPP